MTKPAGRAEETGEKCSQVSAVVLKIKAKFFPPSKMRKALAGELIPLNNSESSVCKVGSICLLLEQNHAELLYAALTTSGLGMRAAESCSAISSLLP